MKCLQAGAASLDITPKKPVFLHGYPHIERTSEGIHDPLYASALLIEKGGVQIVLCTLDIIFVSKEITAQIRRQVQAATDIPVENMMIAATHTHSGPVTVSDIFHDPVVPEADPEFVSYMVDRAATAVVQAYQNKKECSIAIIVADGTGAGGNRRSKTGAADPEIPVLVVKESRSDRIIAMSVVYSMHPTVLHEDSRLISADFPGYTRGYIQNEFGEDVVFLYQTGPCGNQSPRHFIASNTFEESKRLGSMLGKCIVDGVERQHSIDYRNDLNLFVRNSCIMLPKKKFMSPSEAEKREKKAALKLAGLRKSRAPASEIRTAEVDCFGAEENLQLSAMAADGRLNSQYADVLPAEIDVIGIGDYRYVYLPGELFVEYSLMIKTNAGPKTFVVSMANGVLYGYIATVEAEQEGGYEALNSIFPSAAGQIIVEQVLKLLDSPDQRKNIREI